MNKNTNRDLINSAKTKKALLSLADARYPNKFKRVSDKILDRVADRYAAVLRDEITNHPNVGKTLM